MTGRLSSLRPIVRAQLPALHSALGLLVLGVVLIACGTPLWWFGASACVGASLCLYYAFLPQWRELGAWLGRARSVRGRTIVLSDVLLDVLYSGILIWVATIMMRDLIFGVRPISHDHTVHYFKAWQLREHFLPRFQLHGFSHLWFAGYPVNYLYPVGTDLFVNIVDLLGFGAFSFARAYGIAFWLFHAFTGLAGYRLGRMLAGPHVGLLSGFLLMTDLSAFRFGGWAYTIEYGVWPQALSLVFALLATVRVPQLYQERGLRPIGAFALWMGASIITHPIELIYLGVMLVAAVLAGLFSPEVRTARGTVRLLVAYALSALVAAVWLFPFVASGSHTTPMGVWWDSTYELGKGLITLEAFPGTIGYVLAFGVLACILILQSRQFSLLLCVFMALLVPTLSNSSVIDELHLPQLSASFGKIQWLRMATMAKPFWFVIAAYLAIVFLRRAKNLLPEELRASVRPRSLARDVVFGMVVAQLTLPFAVQAGQSFFTSNIAKSLNTETDRALDTDRADLVSWLQTHLPKDGFYRVCISTGHNHDLLDIGTQIDRPIYKRGFTPAENFIYKMNTEDDAVLQAVNVRYMVVKKWLAPDKFEHLAQFGIYQVYQYKLWQPQPFVVTQGSGSVTLERFESEEIVLRAAPGSHGKLRLNVSYFPRWHAYRDGKPVALWPSVLPEAANNTGFMTVWLEPGVYTFRFEPNLLDRVSLWLSVLGIGCALALVLGGHVGRVRSGFSRISSGLARVGDALEQLSAPRFVFWRRGFIALGALAALAALVSLAQWRPPLALENLNNLVVDQVKFDFLEQLSSARVWIDYSTRPRRCRRLWDRFACRTEDGNIDNEKYVASTPAEIEEYRMVRCIRARPEDGARLSIEYPEVPTGEAIVGYYGIERAGRMLRLTRPVDFRIEVDGAPVYAGATSADNKMHWFKADVAGPERTARVRFEVSAANIYRRFFCFYAQMADLREAKPEDKAERRRSISVDDDDAR
jgi:hypothetical protein